MFIDRPPAPGTPHYATPLAVTATPTRDVAPGELPGLLGPALDWFASADIAFKKVDSLLRGNSFAEIAWLMGQGRFARAVFAPAFPAQGRITVDDRQWLVTPDLARHGVATPLGASFADLGLRSCVLPAPDAPLWHACGRCVEHGTARRSAAVAASFQAAAVRWWRARQRCIGMLWLSALLV